jgi:cytochrome P450
LTASQTLTPPVHAARAEAQTSARMEAFAMPLESIDVSKPRLFQDDTVGYYFERLRRDAPVHYQVNPVNGGFWSVTKYADIMQVDTNHGIYSSDWAKGGIVIFDEPMAQRRPSFIAMDQPEHDLQRKSVSSIVAPANLATMQDTIRSRTAKVLDELPRNQPFNWVERVSIELTTQMLATLFDFPFEDRKLLTYWSDVTTSAVGPGRLMPSLEARSKELENCLAYFTRLWNERVNAEPKNDLISMLAHAPATRNMSAHEFMGNLSLLIVGGNDTRSSMTGGLLALHQNPAEFAKLRANPALVESLVPEIIRWQTPLAHMRRTALVDTELGGQHIKAGDKVVMWYLSGNRDEDAIENADQFIIDRARPRQHLAFGFGIHRCVGNRLAEMQIKILWEEILKRFERIDVVGEPERVLSNFVRGFTRMDVQIAG